VGALNREQRRAHHPAGGVADRAPQRGDGRGRAAGITDETAGGEHPQAREPAAGDQAGDDLRDAGILAGRELLRQGLVECERLERR